MFQEKFSRKIQELTEYSPNSSFLLAVSGGVDSMVLLWLFANRFSRMVNGEWHFQVAHINYKLRGEDSDLDQKIVENFCKKYGIKLHLYEVSEQDNCPKNGSIQLWARNLRYRFFREVQQREKLDFLVTAHHLNDQLETFFINLSRGSGIAGLSGIPTDENGIFRPLLEFSKAEIYAFAKAQNIPYREDVSNQKNDYLRNKIRNEIVPKFTEINPDFLGQFAKSLDFLNQSRDFIQSQIEQVLEALTLMKNDEIWVLDKGKLAQKSNFEKFEILRKFGFENEWENAKIFTAETGKIFHSQAFSLLINRNELVLKSKNSELKNEKSPIVRQISDNEYFVEGCSPFAICHSPKAWSFDKDKIKLPLTLRKRQDGDVFYPIGMRGKKKVSKFLKDEKISQWDKEKTWVLTKDNQQLIKLKHDHRHQDGTEDKVTQYGGTNPNHGFENLQMFPADGETAQRISYASTNVWWITLDENIFTYNLRRIGSDRVFSVSFDVKKPVVFNERPWGWKNKK